ncbi:hypothetical protein QJS66_08355 [Kocuria rhizophila]|nr:hypothetical protein QJS66_08355 [Kocuria rhizophila]
MTASTDRGRRAPHRRLRQGRIDLVHVRHEEAACSPRAPRPKPTGKLAVCAVVRTGSCTRHQMGCSACGTRSGAPVLAIASHIPSQYTRLQYFQETHPGQDLHRVLRVLGSW